MLDCRATPAAIDKENKKDIDPRMTYCKLDNGYSIEYLITDPTRRKVGIECTQKVTITTNIIERKDEGLLVFTAFVSSTMSRRCKNLMDWYTTEK